MIWTSAMKDLNIVKIRLWHLLSKKNCTKNEPLYAIYKRIYREVSVNIRNNCTKLFRIILQSSQRSYWQVLSSKLPAHTLRFYWKKKEFPHGLFIENYGKFQKHTPKIKWLFKIFLAHIVSYTLIQKDFHDRFLTRSKSRVNILFFHFFFFIMQKSSKMLPAETK